MAQAYSEISERDPLVKDPQSGKRLWQLGITFGEPLDMELLRACLGELCATFLFLYVTVLMIVLMFESNSLNVDLDAATRVMIALCFGLSIFVLVFMFAEVSGANINPAVTLSLVLGKRISFVRGVLYTAAQCLGATLGCMLVKFTVPEIYAAGGGGVNAVNDYVTVGGAVIGETICTAILCICVLFATDELTARSNKHVESILPLAIGMAVTIAHFALLAVDGCSINPARTFGAAFVADNFEDHWVFWVGPYLGAVIAIVTFEGAFRPLA